MQLNEMLDRADADPMQIDGICVDSREVTPGDLFIAVKGTQFDGHDFVDQALRRGAVAVCAEHEIAGSYDIPIVVDPSLSTRLSAIAGRFYDEPSANIFCIGVTGTNGKTSIAHHCAALMKHTGFMGTIGWGVVGNLHPTLLTTENAVKVQQRLRCLCSMKQRSVAIEVSSHALDQSRVADVMFDLAVFSNLSRDHIDYHGGMNQYAEAKAKLFQYSSLQAAVINVDESFGRELASRVRARGLTCITYGIAEDAEVRWIVDKYTRRGIRGKWYTKWGEADLNLPLFGEFSVANVAAAMGVAIYRGYTLSEVADVLGHLPSIPGRMETYRVDGRPTVVIDYAHTPNALRMALSAIRVHMGGRLICVFGCGGERDQGKRPMMGAAVASESDMAIVTADNPRTEKVDFINEQIVEGFGNWDAYRLIPDRGAAVLEALNSASPDDVVLIAGKGHENTQEINGQKNVFDDRVFVKNLLGLTD